MKISPVFARYPVSSLKTGSLDAIALDRENLLDFFIEVYTKKMVSADKRIDE